MGRCLDENVVLAFFEGRLSARENGAIQRHVDVCDACRAVVAEVARTSTAPAAPEKIVIRDGKVTRRAAPRADELVPGVVLADRYRLDRILGEGGAGVVWQATHTVMRRPVALKILKAATDEATRRFFREARVTAALRHPNIVEVHDVFVVPQTGAPAMVMELLVGVPLARWVRPEGQPPRALSVRDAARALLPVVLALETAHAVGVVHRDLKPENVFLVGDRAHVVIEHAHVKVLDFGLAKLTAGEGHVASSGQLTKKGLVLGTPHYMAPEQVAVDGAVDARADVWALGVMLHEALAGERPFEGSTMSQIFRAIAAAKAPPLAKRAPKVPRALARVVDRMLAKDPDGRPSLVEIREALSAAAG